jgi:hypothetical protein
MPPSTPPTPPGIGSRLPNMPTKNACVSTASGGASPNAWNEAHRTATWKAQNSTAPASAGSGWRRCWSASRIPADAEAGRFASRCAHLPSFPWPRANPSSRRCRSVGTSAVETPIAVRITAMIAGTTVRPKGAGPWKMPSRSPRPQTISAAM